MDEEFHLDLPAKASALPTNRSPAPPSEAETLGVYRKYLRNRIESFVAIGNGDELEIQMPSDSIAAALVAHSFECCERSDLHISSVGSVIRVVIVRTKFLT